MAKNGSMIALPADPDDPEDFDVTFEAVGPQRTPVKRQVTLRLDQDVVAKFRETGTGWQSRINAALRLAAPRAGEDRQDAA